jgi:hypothetical protein
VAADVREIKVADAIQLVEVNEEVAIADRDVTGHR